MAITTFSLPVDIPWRRIAFSRDMMDKVACDRELPLRWRSSVAVFEYEPPDDQQRLDDFKVSYLKVACTITGYQPYDQEIRIRDRLGRSGWTNHPIWNALLTDVFDRYHACYGAMIEVVVAPPPGGETNLEEYPYFSDFDPKKRELYELVSDTGEIMSRSLDEVGVRLGSTTSQSHEVKDKLSVGVSFSAGQATGGPGASAGYESTTTDLNQRSTQNMRSTDASRESRESFSHTTQLSQMYHQLNSYHLGTNRAAFFVLPRPHVIQSDDRDGTPRTFVDGPRQLEGIQEFMLVVVRPKSLERICVEAYLETAHRIQTTASTTSDESVTPLNWLAPIDKEDPNGRIELKTLGLGARLTNHLRYTSPPVAPPAPGYVVNREHPQSDKDTPGFRRDAGTTIKGDVKLIIDVQDDHVTAICEATAIWYIGGVGLPWSIPYLELAGTVFWKKVDSVANYEDTLFITGRAVCSCQTEMTARLPYEESVSVVYEKAIPQLAPSRGRPGEAMSIHDANRLGTQLQREVLESLSSSNRYPRNTLSLLDTQLVAGAMATPLAAPESGVNFRLAEWKGFDEGVLHRLTAYSPSITRAQLMQLPLARQVEQFGLSYAEVVALRRALADLKEPVGSPPVPERPKIKVPMLTGLQLREAREVLVASGLRIGTSTEADSPLPSNSIVAQSPAPGATVEPDTEVSVEFASGLVVRVPELIGIGVAGAACALRQAGLRSEPILRGTLGAAALVAEVDPPAGSLITPDSPVTIQVARSDAASSRRKP
jgi:hypothetical protein